MESQQQVRNNNPFFMITKNTERSDVMMFVHTLIQFELVFTQYAPIMGPKGPDVTMGSPLCQTWETNPPR